MIRMMKTLVSGCMSGYMGYDKGKAGADLNRNLQPVYLHNAQTTTKPISHKQRNREFVNLTLTCGHIMLQVVQHDTVSGRCEEIRSVDKCTSSFLLETFEII